MHSIRLLGLNVTQMLGLAAVRVRGSKEGRMLSELGEEQEKGVHTYTHLHTYTPPHTHTLVYIHTQSSTHTHTEMRVPAPTSTHTPQNE